MDDAGQYWGRAKSKKSMCFGVDFGFFKPFLKGKILQSESERGVNSILITILRF